MIRSLAALALALSLSVPALADPPETSGSDRDGGPPIAHAARIAGDAARTRFIVDLSRAVGIRVFALPDPYRVVVDVPELNFQLPLDSGREGRGLVSAFRYGLFAPGKSRIVLDTTGPVAIDKAFVLDPKDGQPARLVVDLVGTDREAFLRRLVLDTGLRGRAEAGADSLGQVAPAGSHASSDPVIVLDPGHGGIDSGAISAGGVLEKDVVLDFARLLKEKLERSGQSRVLLTRNGDHFLPLPDRVRFAREARASLFLSIHADAIDAEGVRGATVYVLSDTASDAEAAALADKENRADLVAGFDIGQESGVVGDILIDLTQRETKNLSVALARGIVDELRGAARLNKNFLRAAGFRVLRAPDVPSLLLELGYLSSPQDAKLLTSGEWRERTAEAVARAVGRFLGVRTVQTGRGGG